MSQYDFYNLGSDYINTFTTQPWITEAVTIISVVEASSNSTSVRTVFPHKWKPPPTNAEGTQTQDITYWFAGTQHSTTIAFPTPFINWPASYTSWDTFGNITSTVTPAITAPTPQFSGRDQYTCGNVTYGSSKSWRDPKGLLAVPQTVFGSGPFPLQIFYSLFPDHPGLHCEYFSLGPDIGGFNTPWALVVSTEYAS
ncbi:hypothetical protein PG984_003598 [Apiospora sp. TS-2023a]